MIDFTSTPIMLTLILGAVGVLIPVINVARKEKGSSVYGAITLGALLAAIGFVIYQIITKHVTPSAIFSSNVLVDDKFGSFFAIAMLIVGIMTTVGSFNYMRKRASDKSEVKPGAKIIIFGAVKKDDGVLEANRVNIGRDGITPPM